MCRIAVFPPGTRIDNPRTKGLLDFLVKDNGGQSAGMGRIQGNEIQVMRGVEDTPEELLEFAMSQKEWDKSGWIFHTRIASSGPKVKELAQPISTDHGLLVHNGHWTGWEEAFWPLALMGRLKKRSHVNDSVTAAEIASMVGPGALRWIPTGVFVWWGQDGKMILCKNGGEFHVSSFPKEEGGGIIFASKFPEDWGTAARSIETGRFIELGQAIPKVGIEDDTNGVGVKAARIYPNSMYGGRGAGYGGRTVN